MTPSQPSGGGLPSVSTPQRATKAAVTRKRAVRVADEGAGSDFGGRGGSFQQEVACQALIGTFVLKVAAYVEGLFIRRVGLAAPEHPPS